MVALVGVSRDALHAHVGMALFLVIALALRRQRWALLGPVDISWYPQLRGGECQEAKEGDGGLVVSGCDAPELLELVEHALDPIAVLVGTVVAGDGLFAVGLGRDDRQNPLEQQAGADIVAVVALVGQHQPGFGDRQGDQVIDGFVV